MRPIPYLLLAAAAALTLAAPLTCVLSSASLRERAARLRPVREAIGLPSIAIGTSYPATRNPLLEPMSTPLLDVPGGYCYMPQSAFTRSPVLENAEFRETVIANVTAKKVPPASAGRG